MKKRKIDRKKLAVFLLICQCIAATVPGNQCLAENESVQESETMTNTEENSKEQEIAVQELDMGDYETEMSVGEKQLLVVAVLPMNATNQNITYSSSNTQVASVNGMGRITAISVGITEITACCGTVSASFTLNIVKAETEKLVEVTDIELADYEEELQVGKTMSLSATALPADATDTTVKFSSDNTQIATVTSTGEVKGVAPGQVTITMQAGNFTKSIVLTVKTATTAINLNSTYVVLKCGETYQLSGQVLPKEASQALTFKSIDTGIASVSGSGTITAKAVGNTTIIVSNGDISNAVTVIINKAGVVQNEAPVEDEQIECLEATAQEEELLQKLECESLDKIEVEAEEYEKITSVVLKALHISGKKLIIQGKDYTIELSGGDIVNYENPLYTGLTFEETPEGIKFILNHEENLPGQITVSLPERDNYKYIYLYNTSVEKYERIQQERSTEIYLNIAGTYLLTSAKLKSDVVAIHVIIKVVVIILGLSSIHIIMKKKYWFW